MRLVAAALLALALAAAPARAADVAFNVGAVEVVGIPNREQVGFYPYLGVSLVFSVPHAALIPSLSIEAAPDTGRWGFVAALVADFPVQQRLGLDVGVTLLHDQAGDAWSAAELLVGAGGGFSVYLGRWTISPFVNVFRDLMVDAWVVVPGINFAATR